MIQHRLYCIEYTMDLSDLDRLQNGTIVNQQPENRERAHPDLSIQRIDHFPNLFQGLDRSSVCILRKSVSARRGVLELRQLTSDSGLSYTIKHPRPWSSTP